MPQETVAHYRLRERLGSGAMGEVWLAEELQDRLVAELVAGLRGQLPAERPEDTQSLEAYEACSKGLLNLREESQESIDRAIVFFERAVALDPGYARAHMLLGAALDLAVEAYERRMRTGADDAMSPYYAAGAHALRGESGPALDCLERTAARRPRLTAARAAIEPALETLRDEPRFRATLQAIR